MNHSFANWQAAHREDAEHFDTYWREMFDKGNLPLIISPDEQMWQQDLGRSLKITFDWLGDLRGKRVLELGCGPGEYTVMMARRGAHVTALDIAPASLEITRQRAEANGVGSAIQTTWMAADMLGFLAQSFDWVVGLGLLHHVNPAILGAELRRVLRPDGRALFREPLGTNPVLEFARHYLPYRGKHHSATDRPLHYDEIHALGKFFRATRMREFYLFSMVSRAVGGEMSFPWLWQLDEFMIERMPFVRPWCRYILLEYSL